MPSSKPFPRRHFTFESFATARPAWRKSGAWGVAKAGKAWETLAAAGQDVPAEEMAMDDSLGAWSRAASGPARPLALEWTDSGMAVFDPLPGWKAPLWRVEKGALELLRPEGLWRADLKGRSAPFRAAQRGAEGWSSRRGFEVDPRLKPCWRAQFGTKAWPATLDASMEPPPELEGRAHASGELAKWELTEEGEAVAWLDDAFERGPFSCSRSGPFLLVSNGGRKVAYFVGASHWAWPMIDRGLLSVRLGRGGGWEAERDVRPIFM